MGALMPDDSPTLLKGKPKGKKVVAWSEPMLAGRRQGRGQGLGCTVNDVLLSCVAGAIGEYLLAQGQDPGGQGDPRHGAGEPAPAGKAWQLGNRFGLAPLVLPIGIDNPIERLYAVRRRMGELKGSYQPLLAFAVLSVSGLFIKPVQDAILGLFAKKATAVMTNVPGPGGAAAVLRQHAAAEHVLGAGLGRHRHGRVHPQLRRRRAVRPHHRRTAVPRAAGHHRPFRARIRQAAAG
jgi:diacylglycerol O-acyltransferase